LASVKPWRSPRRGASRSCSAAGRGRPRPKNEDAVLRHSYRRGAGAHHAVRKRRAPSQQFEREDRPGGTRRGNRASAADGVDRKDSSNAPPHLVRPRNRSTPAPTAVASGATRSLPVRTPWIAGTIASADIDVIKFSEVAVDFDLHCVQPPAREGASRAARPLDTPGRGIGHTEGGR